jgi:hypothetical protein
MSYVRPMAEIRIVDSGSEVRVFVAGSYRTTVWSEHDAREWCRARGLTVESVKR